MQILLVDEPIAILINHVESFFEFLDLSLIKHGKDIGCRTLGALLCGLPLGFTAGHLENCNDQYILLSL